MKLFEDPALNLAIAMAKYPLSHADLDALIPVCKEIKDWDKFLFWVRRHEITGAVLENSIIAGQEFLPAKVHKKLGQLQQQKVIRAMELQKVLGEIDQRFKAEGVEFSVIKGIVLSQQLYKSISFRSSGDLDIVVSENDMLRVEEILISMQFKRFHPIITPSPFQRNTYMRFMYHFVFQSSEGLLVEVHWSIMKPYLISKDVTQKWLKNALKINISAVTAQTLSLEDNFIYLCLHAARHYWSHAKYLADLVGMVNDPNMDWSLVADNIKQNGIDTAIAANLLLLQRIYQIEIPSALQNIIQKGGKTGFLMGTAMQSLKTPKGHESTNQLRRTFGELFFKNSFRYKVYFIISIFLAVFWRMVVRFKK